MKDIIDISIPLTTGMICWPGSYGFKLIQITEMKKGDPANGSRIDTDVHIGTHIDAPSHSIIDGATIDKLPLEVLIGHAYVLYLPDISEITSSLLERSKVPKNIKRLLFHTKNSQLWIAKDNEFRKDFVALTKDAAEWIVSKEIQLVGIDYLSIQQFGNSMETHNIMLRKNIVIVEGLNLYGVEEGMYELICLPLRIIGAEGAPARAILRKME